MAATTASYDWPRSSPVQHSSSDTASPVFPERPIRPLPKRRLRNRLSPEQAESIVFPPAPPSSVQLFSFPYSQGERQQERPSRPSRAEHQHTCDCGAHHSEVESEEEDDDERVLVPRSSPTADRGHSDSGPGKSGQRFNKPSSASSSADGYESFENTNNKKKRKIPNTGSGSGHNTNLSAEMAGMGLSSNMRHTGEDAGDGAGQGHASALNLPALAMGISGAGRGRYGRGSSRTAERRPLGTSTNALNAIAVGSSGKSRRENSHGILNPEGIISTAIANAQAQLSPNGNENVSLLQQQASKVAPKAGQFTFTVESDTASRMVWPGQNSAYPLSPAPRGAQRNQNVTHAHAGGLSMGEITHRMNEDTRRMKTNHGTQSSPKFNHSTSTVPHDPMPAAPQPPASTQPALQPIEKPRRRPSREFALAARQRRVQQEFANWHHPPRREDVWICEFCEYEAIFGVQPEALIRQYEIKDKRERKRLAEKRRLLEKARMKGRKGKKGSKNSKNAGHGQQPTSGIGMQPQQGLSDDHHQSNVDTHDEYYDDDIEDGSDDVPELEVADSPHSKIPSTTATTGRGELDIGSLPVERGKHSANRV